MAKPYNINNAVATVTNVAMQAFHDQNNIIKDEITKAKEGPYIQVKLEVDVGAIRKPIIHIETQSPNPFDGKESIFVSLSSTRLPKGDMISTFITASDEEDLKYKVKDFVKESWYYIKDGLNGMLGSTRYILENINNLKVKGNNHMHRNRYMKESSNWEALLDVAERIMYKILKNDTIGEVEFYGAMPPSAQSSLKNGNYTYVEYEVGTQTDSEGGIMVTLTTNGKSWDTFIYEEDGASEYNIETIADAIESLLPYGTLNESRKHAEARGELLRAFNYRSEGLANFSMNIGPVEEARISWETKSDGSMKANLHCYYMRDDTTEHVTQYITGDDAQELADNIIEYINIDYGNFKESKMTYNRQQAINKVVDVMLKEFNDVSNIVQSSPTNPNPYISIRKTIDVGGKNKPIAIIETQDLEPFENKSKIYVDLGSTNMRATDGIFDHIYASSEAEFKNKFKEFINNSWYYIQNGLEGIFGESRIQEYEEEPYEEEVWLEFSRGMDTIINTAFYNAAPRYNNGIPKDFTLIPSSVLNENYIEFHKYLRDNPQYNEIKCKVNFNRGTPAITLTFTCNGVSKTVTKPVYSGDLQPVIEDLMDYPKILRYAKKLDDEYKRSHITENRMKGNTMKKRYMKESVSSWKALIFVAEAIVDNLTNYGDKSGKVDFYDALPYDYYGPLKDFVGNTEGYKYIKYKVGSETDGHGGTIVTLSVNDHAWDTFVHLADGSSEYNINTVAETIETLLPSEALQESRGRASRKGSYYRESSGYTINNIQSPLVKAILKNDKVTKEFNVSLPLNGVPGVDTVVAKGKIGGKINITANKGSKVVYAPYKGKLTAKNEEDIDESVFAFVRHIKDNVLNDFDRSGPDVKDNTKNFGKTYKFESRGSLASYKYFKESLNEMVRGGRRKFNESGDKLGEYEQFHAADMIAYHISRKLLGMPGFETRATLKISDILKKSGYADFVVNIFIDKPYDTISLFVKEDDGIYKGHINHFGESSLWSVLEDKKGKTDMKIVCDQIEDFMEDVLIDIMNGKYN